MTKNIPRREEVDSKNCWDLSSLFNNEQDWEKSFQEFCSKIDQIMQFKGSLHQSAQAIKVALDFITEMEELEERLAYWAHLKVNEDQGNSENQGRMGRYISKATDFHSKQSWFAPELQSIPDDTMQGFLEDPCLEIYRISLEKILRFKPHILSEKEERLLAMQMEFAMTASKAFKALTDVDFDFGIIEIDGEKQPLSQSSYRIFLENENREIRQQAWQQFYDQFDKHANTLAALYNGSVQRDIYNARVRQHPSAIEAKIFPDNIPLKLYENLIDSVHQYLPVLHQYYELRRKALGLDKLSLADVYVSPVKEIKLKHNYEEAVDICLEALKPLGKEYGTVLKKGLLGGWVDRYENKGKYSGAFSAGSYKGYPYILLNFKEESLRDVFTLVHEAGHSMHTWYSAANNPFPHYDYTIFEAETASTFNEQLLADYLLNHYNDKNIQAYLVSKQLDDMLATLFRQTMFAEYEKICHEIAEKEGSLTLDRLRGEYKKLLEMYFGPNVQLDKKADLEGLRIPHFYSSFYVYKYATGISAAIALSRKVLKGGEAERQNYLNFLKSGGSKYPLESLKAAGVDLTNPEPVQSALEKFKELCEKLEKFLN